MSRFDVFSVSPGNPLWFGSTDELNGAISQMEETAHATPRHYFVFDSVCQTVVASINTDSKRTLIRNGESLVHDNIGHDRTL